MNNNQYIDAISGILYKDDRGNPELVTSHNGIPEVLGYLISQKPILACESEQFFDMDIVKNILGTKEALVFAIKHSGFIQQTEYWKFIVNANNDYYDVQEYLDKHPEGLDDLHCQAVDVFNDIDNIQLFKSIGYDSAVFFDPVADAINYVPFDAYQIINSNDIDSHLTGDNVLNLKINFAKRTILEAIRNRTVSRNIQHFSQASLKLGLMAFTGHFTEFDPMISALSRKQSWTRQDSINFTSQIVRGVTAWLRSEQFLSNKLLYEVPRVSESPIFINCPAKDMNLSDPSLIS